MNWARMSFNRLRRWGAVMVIGVLVPGTVAAGEERRSVHVRGSTTLLPMAQRAGELYMADRPGVIVALIAGGTFRAYKSIIDGTADIGLASGPFPPELQKRAADRGVKVVSATVAHIAVVPVVHPSNPLSNLSADRLKAIFAGRINNWKSVNGRSAPINVFSGPPTDGTTELWKEAVIGDEGTITPRAAVVSAAELATRVAADPLAIGFLALGSLTAGVRPVKIDGVAATAQTIRDGRYPVRGPLMLVMAGKPSAVAEDFIRFFLDPLKGLRFAETIGAVAVK